MRKGTILISEGDRIQASIRKTLIYKFEKEIREGFVYSIANFGFASNGGAYSVTRHQYKLSFQYGTKVLLVDTSFVSISPFAFVTFPEICDNYDSDYLVGRCISYKLECALFGPYVDELNSFLASRDVQQSVDIRCVVMGTIKHVLDGEEWWYTTCNCNKAIKVRVIDDTDFAIFVIFDHDATSVMKKSCADMIECVNKISRTFSIPKVISDLVEKTFLLKVETKNTINPRFDQSYRVKKLCSNPQIVQKFKLLSSSSKDDDCGQDSLNEPVLNGVIVQDLMGRFLDVLDDNQTEYGEGVYLDLT
ncbi:replication factor-A carboxy-terminal domain protein [Spatholobus suberectus]|nr:replication factor-A carboxy-terminal domain protein [Spatholobus suberectus]